MKKNKLTKNKFILIIFAVIVFISVGYSTFNATNYIEDIAAIVRVKSDIRVTNVVISDSTAEVVSNYTDYDVKSISSEVYLPYSDSSITYKVSVTNFESLEMGIFDITGLPDNLEYSISEYDLKDKICDENGKCNLGITKDVYITVKYKGDVNNSDNTTYNFNLLFDFRSYHTITYENIYGRDYPIEVIDGDKLVLDLEYDDVNLSITNSVGYIYVLNTDYEYNNSVVTVPTVNEDLYIEVNDKILITKVTSSNSAAKVIKYFDGRLKTAVTLSNSAFSQYNFNITIYNSTDYDQAFLGITYDQSKYDNKNITFALSGLKEGDIIEAGESIQFSLIFRYVNGANINSQNILNSFLEFNFDKIYYVTYENLSSTSGYPTYVKDGGTLSVSFGTLDAPIEVKKSGSVLSSSDYSYSNYNLIISNVDGDIHIRKLTKYTLVNKVTNGSFENGLTGWTISGSSSSWGTFNVNDYFGNVGAYRVASSVGSNFIRQNIYWDIGNKYYYFAYGISVTEQTLACNVTNRGGKFTVTTISTELRKGSTIYTADFTGWNTISVNYAATTDNINVDGIGLVDLTAAFGAGNEPSLEWCNANINYFDGSQIFYR